MAEATGKQRLSLPIVTAPVLDPTANPYLRFFKFVHNVRKQGKALLGTLIELLAP
jgi:hypothetical protein